MAQRIYTFTDETGQDLRGREFIVCTVIVDAIDRAAIEQVLLDIEKQTGKRDKWHNVGHVYRLRYVRALLDVKLFNYTQVYYSRFHNQTDYISLICGHIAKAILAHVGDEPYESFVLIDRMDRAVMVRMVKELKRFHIRYKKIRGIKEEADPFIRLADACCGLLRDLSNNGKPEEYNRFGRFLKEI